jgi:pyruvate dehydrogenase E2 component (dihydrolipoamide acetyltransferase)
LAKILIPEGEEIDVGKVVAITVEDEADIAAFKNFTLADIEGEGSAAEPEAVEETK